MAELKPASLKWNELLDNLAHLTRGAYRFVQTDGRVEEAGRASPICQRLREVRGTDFCREHCWLAERCGEQGGISRCAGHATQVALPVRLGGQLLGHLFYGDFRLTGDGLPDATGTTWRSLQELSGLSLEQLQADYQKLQLKSPSDLQDQMRGLKQLLEDQLLDNLLELTIREVTGYVVELSRDKLWTELEAAIRRVAAVGEIEIFTVSPSRDAITRERPDQWDGHDQFADFAIADPEGYAVLPDGRLIVWLVHDTRLLAMFRLKSREPSGFQPKGIRRLRQLAAKIAEALHTRRQREAQGILDRLNDQLNHAKDHRQRLQILLEECLRVLGCQTGEVLLREPDKPEWFQVVARCGDNLGNLPPHLLVRSHLAVLVASGKSTMVVTDISADSAFSSQKELTSLGGDFDDNVQKVYRQHLEGIKSCVVIPLKVEPRTEGILCLNREIAGPFYLGLVYVLEIVAERIASELAAIQITDIYSKILGQLRSKISPRDQVRDLESGMARKQLLDSLVQAACEMSSAYRTAVCMIDRDHVVVAATCGPWPVDVIDVAGDREHHLRFSRLNRKYGVNEALRIDDDYIVGDVNEDGVIYHKHEPDHTSSFSYIPLRGPTVFGVLAVEWDTVRAFDDELLNALRQLASDYSEAYRLFDVAQEILAFEELLKQTGEPEYEQLLESAARMLGVADGALFVRDHDRGAFHLRCALVGQRNVDQPGIYCESGEGLTGWIIANKCSVLVTDSHDEAEMGRKAGGVGWSDTLDGREVENRPSSFVGVPLMFGEEVLGVLRFNVATNPRPFNHFDIWMAENLASRLAARLYDLDEKRRGRAIFGLLEQVPNCQTTDDFLKFAFATLQFGLGSCTTHIRLLNRVRFGAGPEQEVLLRVFARAPDWTRRSDAAEESSRHMPPLMQYQESGASGWVWREDKTLVDHDVHAEGSLSRQLGLLPGFLAHVCAMVVVPLTWNERFVGTLSVYRPLKNSFSPADIRFVERLGGVIAIGLRSLEERERNQFQLNLHRLADNFVTNVFRPHPKLSLQRDLCEQVLGELLRYLHGENGWMLWPNDSGTEFGIVDLAGTDLSFGPPIETELLRRKIGAQGFRHALRIGDDPDVEMWLRLWMQGNRYVERANVGQTLLIAMEAGDRLLTAFCIVTPSETAILSDRIRNVKEVLDAIAGVITLATAHSDEQRRFENAAEPMAMIGTMYSSMEHALRSPVNNLAKHLEYLSKGDRTREQVHERHQLMSAEVEILDQQTKAMLLMARQDSFHRIPLRPILESAAKQLSQNDGAPRLELGMPYEVEIQGSEELLKNAFGFVLKNAWEAAEEVSYGEVSVTLLRMEDEMCCVTVSDNGPGMPEEKRRNVMKPWTSTKGTARGLGLPAAYLLVRFHRGTMNVESEPGRGTKVTITLPAERWNQI